MRTLIIITGIKDYFVMPANATRYKIKNKNINIEIGETNF